VDDGSAASALTSARLLVSGSAPLPVPVFARLAELTGHRPIERYGSTESLITISTRVDGERRPGWVGLPVNGIETRLVDEAGAEAAYDGETIGQLHVRGSTLFDGYLNRPDATAEAVDTDGWYRTGDFGHLDGETREGRDLPATRSSARWRRRLTNRVNPIDQPGDDRHAQPHRSAATGDHPRLPIHSTSSGGSAWIDASVPVVARR